jgi:hypothetical protein
MCDPIADLKKAAGAEVVSEQAEIFTNTGLRAG